VRWQKQVLNKHIHGCRALTWRQLGFLVLADCTNGRAYATALRPSFNVCDIMYCG